MIINEWQDPYWSKLIWRCADHNSYQGCALPERQEYEDDAEVSTPEDCRVDDENSIAEMWGEDTKEIGNLIPFTDEAEWSDGWK